MRHPVDVWLDDVWGRTELVQILAGGEDGGPLADRAVLGWIETPDDLAHLRALSRTGAFTGDICRCPGSLTLSLHDALGEFVGHASLHGVDTISWDRARFHDDLELYDPVGLALLLARNGVTRPLTRFSSRLARVLGLQEARRPQFRESGHGRHGAGLLERRRVPTALRPELVDIPGRQAADLPEDQVEGYRELLGARYPDADVLCGSLLLWLGSLPEPMEADFGEGVLVRRLLERLSPLAAVRALPQPLDGNVALGVMRWASRQPMTEPGLADLLGPCLRTLLNRTT